MVTFTHTITHCKRCGSGYCLGCYGESCPQCQFDEYFFMKIDEWDFLMKEANKAGSVSGGDLAGIDVDGWLKQKLEEFHNSGETAK